MSVLPLILAATVLSPSSGRATLDGAPVELSLADGALEVRSGGGVVHRSSADEQVLGWAPLDAHALLVWFLRRDVNERGVTAHDSGWMEYGATPKINHHLGVYGLHGGQWAPRWVSSAIAVAEAVAVEGGDVILRERGGVTRRWRFEAHGLALTGEPAPKLSPVDTGLVELTFAGDVMLGRTTGAQLEKHGYASAFDAVLPELSKGELRVANLEGCFTEHPPADGTLRFHAELSQLAALKYLKLSAVSVANNHCRGGDRAYASKVLEQAGVGAMGVVRRRVNGVNVALVGLDAVDVAPELSSLDEAARGSDLVVAYVHWGAEYRDTPDAQQKALAAQLVKHGAMVIAGSHPHVVQPLEWLGEVPVAWSLGNFVFDQEGWPTGAGEKTERGALLHVQWHRRLKPVASLSFTRISGRYRVTLESGAEGVIHTPTFDH